MSYRCQVCNTPTEPGAPRRVWQVWRELASTKRVLDRARSQDRGYPVYYEVQSSRKELAREIPVCGRCYRTLTAGVELAELVALHNAPVQLPVGLPPPKPAPPPPPVPTRVVPLGNGPAVSKRIY